MNINTKEIKKGVITINGNSIKTGMTISELESVLQRKIKKDSDYVGHISDGMTEDDKPMSICTWFDGDMVRKLEVDINGFYSDEEAIDYLDYWLKKRGITEWVGDSYYKTDFGTLTPSVVRIGYRENGIQNYQLSISLNYNKIPTRKFSPIRKNRKNSIEFSVNGSDYKIQRITGREADNLPIFNVFGNEPVSLTERKEYSTKNDRRETIYFNISKIENNVETIIGVAEFTYLAIWDAYKNSELFFILDNQTEELGIIGFAIDEFGCYGMHNEKEITPFLLAFKEIHDELPRNKELEVFEKDEKKMKTLLTSAAKLTSKYVKIPEEFLTIINVTMKKENSIFSYHKTFDNIFVNYQRLEKEKIVADISN